MSLQTYGASYKAATPEQRAARKEFMMSGRGKYAMTGRGGFFGRMLGGLVGQPDLGDKLGDAAWSVGKQFLPSAYSKAGDAVFGVTDRLSGQGLYRGRGAYATNNLITDSGATSSSVVPVFNPTDLHTVTYSNREFIKDVYAPAAGQVFSISSWSVNPGLAESFPFLSQIAINFEEYEIIQLAFTYKSTVADFASASGQVGQIVMATQYNPNSDPFADKEDMMLYEGGMSCKTTESMIHGVECDPAKIAGTASKYVRAGNLPPSEDLKNYDLGKTSLAILNCPATYAQQQIGELWVSYTVKLRKPKQSSGNAYNVKRDVFASEPRTVPNTNPLLTANPNSVLRGARNSLGCSIFIPTTTLNCPSGVGSDLLTNPIPVTSGPVQTQAIVTLPPSYAGIIQLRWLVRAVGSTAVNQLRAPLAVTFNTPSTIIRYKDIPDYASDQATWSHYLSTIDNDNFPATTPPNCRADLTLHLRIQPAANGVPNSIYLVLNQDASVWQGNTGVSWYLEVTQYNSFLSNSDAGTNDTLELVNNVTSVTEVWGLA